MRNKKLVGLLIAMILSEKFHVNFACDRNLIKSLKALTYLPSDLFNCSKFKENYSR